MYIHWETTAILFLSNLYLKFVLARCISWLKSFALAYKESGTRITTWENHVKRGIEIATFRLRIRRATNHALRSHIHKIGLNLILKLD